MTSQLHAAAPTTTAWRLKRIQRIGRVAEICAIAGMLAVGGYLAFAWADPQHLLQPAKVFVVKEPAAGVQSLAKAIAMVPGLIFLAAMWEARRLFRLYRLGQIFHAAISDLLVRLGFLSATVAVAGAFVRTIVVLLMTSANPPGQRHLVIDIASSEISALVVGMLLFAFALVTQEASRLSEENQSFV